MNGAVESGGTAVDTMIKPLRKGSPTKAMSILLVEDNFQTTVVIGRVFRELGLLDHLVVSMDCNNALARLHAANTYRPDLILLDLDMLDASALDTLRTLKEDAASSIVPVVVLAGDNRNEDVANCYGLGAAGYVLKSSDYETLLDKIGAVCDYWAMCCLPIAN